LAYRLGQATRQGLNRIGNFISEGAPRLGVGLAALLTPANENQNTREDEIMAAIHGESYNGKPYNKKDAEALLKEMKVSGVTLKDSGPAKLPDTGAGAGRGKQGGPDVPPEAAPEKKTGVDQLRVAPAPAVQPTIQASSAPAAASSNYSSDFNAALKAQGDPRANLPPEIKEMEEISKAQGQKELAAADKRGRGLKALVDKRNERLAGREERVTQEENLNPFMSLLTAGLATMQSKGKGLAGIAEGSQAGVSQYMAEAKYTTAQRQKLEDARDALEDLKFNQENMTEKERLAAHNTITQGALTARKATIDSIAHREDVNVKTAGHIFDAGVQRDLELQRQSHQTQLAGQNQQFQLALNASDNAQRLAIAQMQERAANARLDKLSGEGRVAEILGSGTPRGEQLKKGLEQLMATQGTKFNMQNEYAKYISDWTKAGGVTPKMTMAEYAAQYQGPKLVNLPAANVKP
jgi:hypothetical protein